MNHFVKAWILALGLILSPAVVSAQQPAAPAQPLPSVEKPVPAAPLKTVEEAIADADASEKIDPRGADMSETTGLDPALYTPMKPTPGVGMPVNGGIDFQDQVSATGKQAHWINNAILIPMMVIVSFVVLGLMLWVIARYRKSKNPEPSKTTHNTFIEIIWTVIPVLILLVIAVPSISLLAQQFEPAPEDALTVKVTGYQWYWGYSYPDNGDFEIISNMLTKEEAEARGEPFQLAVDNRLVIPVGKPVKMLITGADVIHSFAIPAAWFKLDAVPGRINEKVLQIDKVGVYYGQCSELCGARHAFMPITVEVLPEDKFNDWVRANGGKTKAEIAAGAKADIAAANAAKAAAEAEAAKAAAAPAAAAENVTGEDAAPVAATN